MSFQLVAVGLIKDDEDGEDDVNWQEELAKVKEV